jgi:ParB family chromosome partitioning protein
MRNSKPIDLGMTGYEELFMNDQERADLRKPKVEDIPLSELSPFKDHPFKVKEDEELERLKESIKESGVLVPALARPKADGGYELISGHRRMAACKELGLETIPVIIRELTDEEAIIAMVDANLQREHILPSEKAFAYKMKLEALKHQGKTSTQVAHKLSVEVVGEQAGESKDQVRRYIRLTNLIPELLKMVDENRIALTPAVELSYLSAEEQKNLIEQMEYTDATPSLSQAQRLRRMSEEQGLSAEKVNNILSEAKGNQKEYLRVPMDELRKFFHPDTPIKQVTETVVKAMEHYNKYLERQRREREER